VGCFERGLIFFAVPSLEAARRRFFTGGVTSAESDIAILNVPCRIALLSTYWHEPAEAIRAVLIQSDAFGNKGVRVVGTGSTPAGMYLIMIDGGMPSSVLAADFQHFCADYLNF
jgi:hypothetical protein